MLATVFSWSVAEKVCFNCYNLSEISSKFLPTIYKTKHNDKNFMASSFRSTQCTSLADLLHFYFILCYEYFHSVHCSSSNAEFTVWTREYD